MSSAVPARIQPSARRPRQPKRQRPATSAPNVIHARIVNRLLCVSLNGCPKTSSEKKTPLAARQFEQTGADGRKSQAYR